MKYDKNIKKGKPSQEIINGFKEINNFSTIIY